MKPYSENSSSNSSAGSSSREQPPAERIKFSSQIPAVLLTAGLVIGAGAWMLSHESTKRAAELEPLRAQNDALQRQADDNRRQLEATSRLLKEALARHDNEVFRPEEELQKLNEERVGLLADAITKKVIPALPAPKSAEEMQRAEEEQVNKVASKLTENLTPLISKISEEQTEQKKTSAATIKRQQDQIQNLDSSLKATQTAAQETLKMTQEVSAMYLDSYKDHGVAMRLFSLPASLIVDVANGNIINDRSKKKTESDLNAKMAELDRRINAVQTAPLASNGNDKKSE